MKYEIVICLVLYINNYMEVRCTKQIEVPDKDSISDVIKYTYVDIKKRRNEAYAVCEKRGGQLLNVKDENTITSLEKFRLTHWGGAPNDDYWISLTELTQAVYVFTDCTQVFSDTGWSYFKDTDYKADEQCYSGGKDNHRWENRKCSDTKDFICENNEAGTCEIENLIVSGYEYFEDTFTNCQTGCQSSNTCWAFLHFGEMNCTFLLTRENGGTIINPLYLKKKECFSAELIADANLLPTVDNDDSIIPLINCSNVNNAYTQSTVIAAASVSSSEVMCSATVTETEMYNSTVNVTVTETETQTINVTETLLSTVIDVQTESIYLTAYATAHETVVQVSSIDCSCPTATVSMVYSITTETITSSVPCPSVVQSCTTSTHTNYITINNTKAIEESIEKLKKELTISPTNTSAHRRKFISVLDTRPSVAAIGYVGLIFLIIPFSLILVIDFTRLVSGIRDLVRSVRDG